MNIIVSVTSIGVATLLSSAWVFVSAPDWWKFCGFAILIAGGILLNLNWNHARKYMAVGGQDG